MNQAATNPEQESTRGAAGWSERGMGHNWQHRFFHVLIRTLGKRPAYHMVYIVTFWYILFKGSLRQRTRYYLNRRFPHRGAVRRFFDSWRLVRNFGIALVDLAVLRILGNSAFSITSPDHDRLMKLCDSPKGFVLLNAHIGCWQVGLSTLGHLRKPISLVMIPDPRMLSMLKQYPVTVIDPQRGLEAVVEMMGVLERGEILCLMGDRVFGVEQNTVTVNFLDGEIKVPMSPYRLASAAGVPVVVLTAPKTGYRSYEFRLARVIDVPTGLGRKPANYTPYAGQFVECLETFVKDYPWQYYNFYNLWSA